MYADGIDEYFTRTDSTGGTLASYTYEPYGNTTTAFPTGIIARRTFEWV